MGTEFGYGPEDDSDIDPEDMNPDYEQEYEPEENPQENDEDDFGDIRDHGDRVNALYAILSTSLEEAVERTECSPSEVVAVLDRLKFEQHMVQQGGGTKEADDLYNPSGN